MYFSAQNYFDSIFIQPVRLILMHTPIKLRETIMVKFICLDWVCFARGEM